MADIYAPPDLTEYSDTAALPSQTQRLRNLLTCLENVRSPKRDSPYADT